MQTATGSAWKLLVIPRTAGIAALALASAIVPARGQDVPGIEICTREIRLDRRTSCLQSNVEFLQQVIGKNSLDAQQKLAAAGRDIAMLKEQLATANRDIAALRNALAAMYVRLDQLARPDATGRAR